MPPGARYMAHNNIMGLHRGRGTNEGGTLTKRNGHVCSVKCESDRRSQFECIFHFICILQVVNSLMKSFT